MTAADHTPAASPALPLTEREQEVLRHIAQGESSKQIARALDVSVRTVETHRLNIKRKLGTAGQAELMRHADKKI